MLHISSRILSYSLSMRSIVTWQPRRISPSSCEERSSAPTWRAAASSCPRSRCKQLSGTSTRAMLECTSGHNSQGTPPAFSGRQLNCRKLDAESSGGSLGPAIAGPMAAARASGWRHAVGTWRNSPLASRTLKRPFFASLPTTSASWPLNCGASARPKRRTRSPTSSFTSAPVAGAGPAANSALRSRISALKTSEAARALSRRRLACSISARSRAASVTATIGPSPSPWLGSGRQRARAGGNGQAGGDGREEGGGRATACGA
mmetsp:Transcript_72562/g.200130  ORF Transcript_72562/g.200130 Transcript_72562/m.200130 type:complete len:262 (+) Transcript_72562:499-1284(+)